MLLDSSMVGASARFRLSRGRQELCPGVMCFIQVDIVLVSYVSDYVACKNSTIQHLNQSTMCMQLVNLDRVFFVFLETVSTLDTEIKMTECFLHHILPELYYIISCVFITDCVLSISCLDNPQTANLEASIPISATVTEFPRTTMRNNLYILNITLKLTHTHLSLHIKITKGLPKGMSLRLSTTKYIWLTFNLSKEKKKGFAFFVFYKNIIVQIW